jgi:hypothetical protein
MRLVGCLCLLATAGCSALAEGDGRTPGDDLGRFRVAASLERSNCGPGALGAPDEWSFDIQLARDDAYVYWNQGGAAVEGTIDGEAFEIASDTVVEVAEATEESLGCTMLRHDRASGVLDGPDLDVRSFTGSLQYSFEAAGGNCTGLVGVEGGFATLPCGIDYRLFARRNLAPRDRHP